MKRADNLFEQITDLENLKLAYLKALKGKRYKPAALIYLTLDLKFVIFQLTYLLGLCVSKHTLRVFFLWR